MKIQKTILIINQTAGSPHHGMVYRNYYMAKEWVNEGHRAIIISGSYFHNFTNPPKTKGLFTKEDVDGVEYWWIKLPRYSQSRSLGRLLTLFLFPLLLLFFPFWKLSKPDSVVVSGPPHLSILNGWIWSKFWGSMLIYEVRDIWPLTIIKLGGINSWNPFILFLGLVERFAYKVSERVVSVLSLADKYFASRGMEPEKFAYIPNGFDLSQKTVEDGEVSAKIALLAKEKKIVIYTGSFGIANNLDQLIQAAEILQKNNNIHFALVGDGPHKKNLVSKAQNLKNVTFFDSVPKKEISAILSHAHVTYVGLMKSDLFKHGISPNKLFDYMAARKPVIMAIDTEDNIVEKAQCGILVPSCSPKDIADAVVELTAKSDLELKKMGDNGRNYLEENHAYSSLAKKYLTLINSKKIKEKFSPLKLSFYLTLILGVISHLVLPIIFSDYFQFGILKIFDEPIDYHQSAVLFSTKNFSDITPLFVSDFPVFLQTLFYKFTGIKSPLIILPLLSLLFGMTVSATLASLRLLGVRGRWWPLIFTLIFTLTPTSVAWMVYLYKDAFVVPGVIFIFWSFLSVIIKELKLKQFVVFLFGAFLVILNRPEFSNLFLLSIFSCLFLVIVKDNIDRSFWKKNAFFFYCILSLVFVTKLLYPSTNLLKISGSLDTLAEKREVFLNQHPSGNTNFLNDIDVDNSKEAIKFLPRVFQLSLLEPLPWRENKSSTLGRNVLFRILKLEMVVVYFCIFFLVVSVLNWNLPVLFMLILSLPFLFFLGFAIPNVGAINNYRFPFLLLIKMAGFAALWNTNRLKWPGRILYWVNPPTITRTKKKVLFLVPDDETFLIQRLVMAQGVKNAGYEVHVAAQETDSGASKKITELGFTFHRLDLNRGGLNPFADFMPFLKLISFLAKERPDILQCVSIKPVLYGATAGTIVGLSKIVCLINGLGYAFEGKDFKGRIIKKLAISLYKNALALPGLRVIFQNPDDQNYFISNKLVDEKKTVLIRGSGVDMKKFRPSLPPKNPKPVILFVGRLLWSKGIRELIEAAYILRKENLDFVLKIVGSPDDRNPNAVSSNFMKEFQIDGTIEWLGRQTDMPKFYYEADILCLPTQYKEGLPLTLLEAGSIGRALVATDVPGCREIVKDGVNGFLVRPKDVNHLVQALRSLIIDSNLREQFGLNSSKIVKDEFSSEIIQSQLLEVYRSLLNDSASIIDNSTECIAIS
jgi:glycosyltransferase involved in cell wall biosynthesis